jgi:hypothetical protein
MDLSFSEGPANADIDRQKGLMGQKELDRAIEGRRGRLRSNAMLTLNQLAVRSGISRGMISRIEHGESSATAVLELCLNLGDVPDQAAMASPCPLSACCMKGYRSACTQTISRSA